MKKFYLFSILTLLFMSFSPRVQAVDKLTGAGDTITNVKGLPDTIRVMLYNAGRKAWAYDVSGSNLSITDVAPELGTTGAMKYVFTLIRTTADSTFIIKTNTGNYIGKLPKGGAFKSTAAPTTFNIYQGGSPISKLEDGTPCSWVLKDPLSGYWINGNGLTNHVGTLTGWTSMFTNSQYIIIPATVESVDEMTLADLTELYNTYARTNYPVDETQPGYYKAATVAPYLAQMAQADSVVNLGKSATVAEITALYKALKAARVAIEAAGVNPVTEGYYIIRNANSLFFQNQAIYKAMYCNSADSYLSWSTMNATSPYFIYYFKSEADGLWSIQNYGTGAYIGKQTTQSANVPMQATAFPLTVANLGEAQFNIGAPSSYAYHTGGHSNGVGLSGYCVAWNGTANSFSAWYLQPVAQTVIDSLRDIVSQAKLNAALAKLISTATAKYNTAFYYDKLVTDSTQWTSNYKEPTEGSYYALIDGVSTTYFHSAWSVASTEKHFLQADLRDKPQTTFFFKTSRRSQNNNNRPIGITIYASNDSVQWDSITAITKGLPVSSTVNDYTSATFTLSKAYRYLRFRVDSTNTGQTEATSAGCPYFTYSAFQIYLGTPNQDRSLYPRMGTSVAELKAALDAAAIVSAGAKATQADIDALQAAYDKFMAAYIDTTLLKKEIATATGLLKGSVEGTAMGQCAAGSIATLQNAITTASAYPLETITTEQLLAAIQSLKAAEKAFKAGVILPQAGKWYYITNCQDATADNGNSRIGQGMYATSGEPTSTIMWGGRNSLDDPTLKDSVKFSPYFIWRLVQLTDTTYAIQNFGSSYYLGLNSGTAGTQFYMSASKYAYRVEYIGASSFRIINDYFSLPLHAQASGSLVVGWDAGVASASSWTFQDAGELDAVNLPFKVNTIQTVCYPFPVNNEGDPNGNVKLYEICGKVTGSDSKTTGIQLKEVEQVEAGVPFIMQVGNYTQYSATSKDVQNTVLLLTDNLKNLDVAAAPKTENGLVGNFASYYLGHAGMGIITGSKLSVSSAVLTPIAVNSAIINEALIQTDATAKVALTLSLTSGVLNAINVLSATKAPVSVYTLQGTCVLRGVSAANAIKSLPKGLYIIGGKKVLVK